MQTKMTVTGIHNIPMFCKVYQSLLICSDILIVSDTKKNKTKPIVKHALDSSVSDEG